MGIVWGRGGARRSDLEQFSAQRMAGVDFFERELARFEPGFDLLDEMQIRLFRVRIVRVTGHGDVPAGRFLVERGGEFTPVEQPAFEVGGGPALRRAILQLVEQRGDPRPITEVDGRGDKSSRPVGG